MTAPKAHLVIIDDDREMRSLLEDYLTNQGYRISSYRLATEALAALESGGPLGPDKSDASVDAIISIAQ
jgi:DNA-binding NtrC family response regulator